ncbi:DUF3310 domain-containing protein [Limosilactobacillus fermentum]
MRKVTNVIRPNYYVDRHGHDLFWQFEHGYYASIAAICFCYLNMLKYEKRAGRKTKDPSEDLKKARTYLDEYVKPLEKREKEEIHDQGLERVLDCSDLKKRKEAYLKRLDRIEEDIKSGRRML